MDILVKYCGGCNCLIDRAQLLGKIEKLLPAEDRLVSGTETDPAALGILMCGCPSACANQPELTDLARRWVLVAGKTVDYQEMPEDRMAEAVVQKLKQMKG